MQYLGGKERVIKRLFPVLQVLSLGCSSYLEPFMGGASVASRMSPLFEEVTLSDANLSVVSMWQRVQEGWDPPEDLSAEEYPGCLLLPDEDPLKAFATFGCSYGGIPGAGFSPWRKGHGGGARTARNSILKKKPGLENACILHSDYKDWDPSSGVFVYCDPPYAGTTGYGMDWDSEEFWTVAQEWAEQGAEVAVSEYVAPKGWTVAATIPTRGWLGGNTSNLQERVFVWTG